MARAFPIVGAGGWNSFGLVRDSAAVRNTPTQAQSIARVLKAFVAAAALVAIQAEGLGGDGKSIVRLVYGRQGEEFDFHHLACGAKAGSLHACSAEQCKRRGVNHRLTT